MGKRAVPRRGLVRMGCLVRLCGRDVARKQAFLAKAQELGRAKFTTFLAARAAAAAHACAPPPLSRARRRSTMRDGASAATTSGGPLGIVREAAASGALAGAMVASMGDGGAEERDDDDRDGEAELDVDVDVELDVGGDEEGDGNGDADAEVDADAGDCEQCFTVLSANLIALLLCTRCGRGGACCGGRRQRKSLKRVPSLAFIPATAAGAAAAPPSALSSALTAVRRGIVIGLPVAMLLGYTAFALWYIVIFGTFQPLHVTWAFVRVWLIAEASSALVSRPINALVTVTYQFAVEPFTSASVSWVPFCRRMAPSAPLGGAQLSADPLDASPLTRSFDCVTLARGVAYASRMGADASLTSQPGGLQLMARAFAARWAEARRTGLNHAVTGGGKLAPVPASMLADRHHAAQRRRWIGALYALRLAEVGAGATAGETGGEKPAATEARGGDGDDGDGSGVSAMVVSMEAAS